MRVVVDEGVPRQVVKALRDRGIDASRFAPEWTQMRNGDLIRRLHEIGIDVLLTNDKNIANQQSLKDRRVAVVALPHNKRRAILERIDDIVDTIRRSRHGQHVSMGWDGSRTVAGLVEGREATQDMPAVAPFRL